MAQLKDVVVDCRHPATLARFWAAALDEYAVAPYDEAELVRLRGIGVLDPEDDPMVVVEGPPAMPRLLFQRVPEPKTAKNRLHLDVAVDDVEAEAVRLGHLGARFVARFEGHVTMRDIEGNEFCVCSS
jgi:hypothetical protein